VSLQNSAILLQRFSQKEKLNENETAQLSNIANTVDVYFSLIAKGNHNTGCIDDSSMRKADDAAEQFFQKLK
jgi:hypothetical protein